LTARAGRGDAGCRRWYAFGRRRALRADFKEVGTLKLVDGEVAGARRFSRDGRHVLPAGGELRIREFGRGRLRTLKRAGAESHIQPAPVEAVAMSRDSRVLACGAPGSRFSLLDVADGTVLSEFGGRGDRGDVAFAHVYDELVLARAPDGDLTVWNPRTAEEAGRCSTNLDSARN
jgi:hypothetical protein